MKRVEFHQATVVVTCRVVDEERSYGVRQIALDLLMDTDQEWAAAREQIREAMVKVQEQVDADSNSVLS